MMAYNNDPITGSLPNDPVLVPKFMRAPDFNKSTPDLGLDADIIGSIENIKKTEDTLKNPNWYPNYM